MRNDSCPAVGKTAVKRLIDQLEREFDSLRKAGKALDIDHQKLSYWRKRAKKQKEFIDAFETIRKALKISRARMWGKMLDEDAEI